MNLKFEKWIFVILLVFIFSSCSKAKLESISTLSGKIDGLNPKISFLCDNQYLYISNTATNHKIYDCETGKQVFYTHNGIKGIAEGRYLLTSLRKVWDLKTGQEYKSTESLASAIVIVNEAGDLKHIITGDRGNSDPYFFNNYSWSIRLVHFDRQRASNDSVDVHFTKTGNLQPTLTIKLPRHNYSYRPGLINDSLIVVTAGYQDDGKALSINIKSGKIKNLLTSKNYSLDFNPKLYATDKALFERDFHKIQMIPISSTLMGNYKILAYSPDRERILVLNTNSEYLEIASKESIDSFPEKIRKAKARNRNIIIGIVIFVFVFVFVVILKEKFSSTGKTNQKQPARKKREGDFSHVKDENDYFKIANNKQLKQNLRIAAIDKIKDKKLLRTLYDSATLIKIKNHLEYILGIDPSEISEKEQVFHSSTPISEIEQYKLHKAVLKKDLNSIKTLLTSGTNINQKDDDGFTPLILAVKENSEHKIIEYLLSQKKIDLDIQDEFGCTALHYAAENQDVKSLKCLLENGADVNIKDNMSNFPINKDRTANPKIFKQLLEAGADPNADSVFLNAAMSNSVESMKLLQKAGADIHCIDFTGKNALDYANQYNNKEAIEYLIPLLDRNSETYDMINSFLGTHKALPKNSKEPNVEEFLKSFGFKDLQQVDYLFKYITGISGQVTQKEVKEIQSVIGMPNSKIENIYFSDKGIFLFPIRQGGHNNEFSNRIYDYVKCLYLINIIEKEKYIEVIALTWEQVTSIDYLMKKINLSRRNDNFDLYLIDNEDLQYWVKSWQNWKNE